MRTRREWDIDRIARHAIGWVILAAGAGYLFFGNYHCGNYDNFGFCRPQGIIEIANQAGGYEVSESKKMQTFLHELTHAILFTMNKSELNDDESFVNTFSSFLNESISTMEE